MGKSRYRFQSDYPGPYFVTCTIIKWIALLGNPDISKIVLDSIKFIIENNRIQLHGYVIMHNHLHLIASGKSIQAEMRNFKSYTARQIVEYLQEKGNTHVLDLLHFFKKRHKIGQDFQVWEEGSHPQLITSVEMLNQKLEYIHYNPVKADFVDDPAYWKHSSYRYYLQGECELPIVMVE